MDFVMIETYLILASILLIDTQVSYDVITHGENIHLNLSISYLVVTVYLYSYRRAHGVLVT